MAISSSTISGVLMAILAEANESFCLSVEIATILVFASVVLCVFFLKALGHKITLRTVAVACILRRRVGDHVVYNTPAVEF